METNTDRKTTPAQRWFALMLVIVNICFNYYTQTFSPDGKTIKDVSDQYASLFTPAPYAFSIWGLIYIAVLIYAVVQALPGRRNVKSYHELAFPLSFLSILSMCWLLSFVNELLLVSEIIIITMLVTSLYALKKAKEFAGRKALSKWAVVPFSLYAGWLSVATLANTSSWLVSMGFNGGIIGPERWAEILLVIAVLVGVVECFKYRDSFYPIAIAWGIIAIWANLKISSPTVSLTALIGGIILLIVAVINFVKMDNAKYSPFKAHLHKG